MSGSTGSRRRGRAFALQVLYALDLSGGELDGAVAQCKEVFEVEVEGDALLFANALVAQVQGALAAIDESIGEASRNWRLERMSRVDRNILRLATSELLYSIDVPAKVAINEAVELAKQFGTSESPAFVNGILDRVAQNAQHS